MLSIALMHGCELQRDPAWAKWMPLSRGLSYLLENGNPELYAFGSHFFKWIHMLLVLGFAMYIPHSKHLHIVAAGPNTFLKNLKKTKAMRTISFEDPEVSQYGASKLTDLSWKDALDYYACTECGRCQDVCPAYQTQKPLSPKKLILDLKHAMQDQKETILAKNYEALPSIIDLRVTEDVIWACTSCRACEIACPVFIEHTDKIFDIRRNLVMMESRFPPEVQTVFKNMENQGTPWAFSPETRSDWAEGLSIKTVAENPEIDVLLWVGCAGAYDERNKKVVRAFASLLKKAQVKFAILGNEERCTGDPARRMGNEYLYQTLARSNIEVLQRYQVKKIVTSCPHCLNTLKNEYPDLGGHYEVFHHAQYLAMLIAQGKIKPSKNYEESITFHDSCYLGRWNGIYQEPREILRSVGANPVEMKSHHQESLCCGAGGGRMWMEEHLGKRINLARTEQALETGASTIATSCPFCLTMLSDGVQSKMATQTKVLDIAELLNEKS
jgi:Fe-S oxidoreductase